MSWAGAPIDEGVQERALCAYSADLTAWSEPVTLFPNVSTAADFDPVQGTNNENFWETPGGSAATPSRLYAFGSIIVDDDPALPRQKGSLIQFLLGRRLEVTDGKLSLGPIFWATDAPPPDLLGYPLHSEVEGDRFARADMALYLGSLLSEFVPGEAQYNHELSERSLYTVPNTSPPQLVQLVRMDSNDTVCPLVTRAATCSACGGNVSKSCMLASTCTLEGLEDDVHGSDGSGAAEPAADYCRIATGSYHLWPVAGAKRRPRCRWSEGVPSTIPDGPSSKSLQPQPLLLSALTKACAVPRILREQAAGERGRWGVHGLQPRPLRLPLQPVPVLRRRQVAELSRPAHHQHRTRRTELLEALGGADGAAAADAGRGGRPALAAQLLLARPPARRVRLPPRVSATSTQTREYCTCEHACMALPRDSELSALLRDRFQYPSAMWREATGEMIVAYSINKEDIAITRFQLSILKD